MNIRHESADALTSLVRRLIASQFPQWSYLPVRPVDRQGNDNRTFRLGNEMCVRLPSAERYVAAVEKEHVWLPRLAPQLPLEIPAPIARGEPGEGYLWHWSIYRWLEGETATVERVNDPATLASSLAEFLRALYRIDPTGGPPAGALSFFRGASLSIYDDQTRQAIASLGDRIDREGATRVWNAALASEWTVKPVWVHGDVAVTNLLVRDGRLAAVLDFGCSAIGDPACDLAIAWTFFDRKTRDLFRAALLLDAETWARGRGWALWKALIVMAQQMAASPDNAQNKVWTHNPMTDCLVVDEAIADRRNEL